VMFGVAGGTVVAVVAGDSVIVSPVVTSDVVTGPGGSGSAELVSVVPTTNTPMAIAALAPIVAETNLIRFDFTSDHSNSVAGGLPRAGGVARRTVGQHWPHCSGNRRDQR
jgi:hypothetical protein